MLLKSGVFSDADYYKELTAQFQKHFDNFGRFNYSIADSSWDSWLDGYVPGTPGRKVSIYTEGCILAFVADIKIRKFSGNKYGLDELMKRLYYRYALENKGVSETDFRSTLVELGGKEMHQFLDDYFYGTHPFEGIVTDALEYIGLKLTHKPAALYSQGRLGMKTIQNGNNHILKSIYPGSPADLAQLQIEDEIIAVNQLAIQGELDKWLTYFDDQQKTVTVIRAGQLHQFTFPEVQRHFYLEYGIQKMNTLNTAQQKAFELWKK